ncbi:hypothetical protein I79_005094 [Cricetulus griseus]|uniref:Uncharacterized protein n=1 Tax=Cricetulus griseus TaxID=10029 RepID=G3H494_CRIGR|nr:hypothetical protein I79_005094 [Cricetulus griseus]
MIKSCKRQAEARVPGVGRPQCLQGTEQETSSIWHWFFCTGAISRQGSQRQDPLKIHLSQVTQSYKNGCPKTSGTIPTAPITLATLSCYVV